MLRGTLDDFTLPDVLRLIGSAGRTGRLDVSRDAGSGRLFFRDGAVRAACDAAGSDAPAEDLTFDLMRWSDGEFSWQPDAAGPAGGETVPVDSLLEHVARRLEELAEIKTLVPSEEAVLAMAPQPPEGAVQINITPGEWRVLVMVDGHRPVSDIALAAGLDDVAAMKVLYGLAAAGLVTLAAPAPAAVEPEPALETRPAVAEIEASAPAAVAAYAAPSSPGASDMSDMSDMTDMTDVSDVSDTSWEDVVRAATHPEPEQEPVAHEPEPVVVPDPQPAGAAVPALETPADPFLEEVVTGPADPFPTGFEAAPFEAPEVDRSTAARELAGLFDDADGAGFGSGGTFVASPPAPPHPRRVEDDDQVTRGLISRLIDGVKGL